MEHISRLVGTPSTASHYKSENNAHFKAVPKVWECCSALQLFLDGPFDPSIALKANISLGPRTNLQRLGVARRGVCSGTPWKAALPKPTRSASEPLPLRRPLTGSRVPGIDKSISCGQNRADATGSRGDRAHGPGPARHGTRTHRFRPGECRV